MTRPARILVVDDEPQLLDVLAPRTMSSARTLTVRVRHASRFIAVGRTVAWARSLNHLVRPHEQGMRNSQPQCLHGLKGNRR
jgi:hypothetical protein